MHLLLYSLRVAVTLYHIGAAGTALSYPTNDIPSAPSSHLFFSRQQEPKQKEAPSPRWATDCVLDVGFLFCYGGIVQRYYGQQQRMVYDDIPTDTMYRLSLYEQWSIDEPIWEQVHPVKDNDDGVLMVPPTQPPPLGYFAAANLPGGIGFLIHGGQSDRIQASRTTLVYDIYRNEWSKPQLQGFLPPQRIHHSATSDNQGRVWIWGGKSNLMTNSVLYDNRWTVIDTNTWAYNYPEIPNPPSPRVDHTATLVPDGNIIIIGGLVYSRNVTDPLGQHTLNAVSMSSLLKFDAAGSQWQNVTATGNIPAPRSGHSAVLSSDGSSIIVFGGGAIENEGEGEFKTLNDVFVLELANMRWSAPSVYGELPLPRKYHTAVLVSDDMMLVGFGLGSEEQGIDSIHLLSTSTWTWISDYQPDVSWLTSNGTITMVTPTTNSNGATPLEDRPITLPSASLPSDAPSSGKNEDNNNGSNAGQQSAGGHNSVQQGAAGGHQHATKMSEGEEEGSHVRAGVIAGVVSGGVVALIGGIIVALSVVYLRRRRHQTASCAHYERDEFDKKQEGYDGHHKAFGSSSFQTTSSESILGQKPDCRSSFNHASQSDDQEERKPDEPTNSS